MGDFKGSQGILLWGMCVEKVAFFSTQKKMRTRKFYLFSTHFRYGIASIRAYNDDP